MVAVWDTVHGSLRGSTEFLQERTARSHDLGQSWRRSKGQQERRRE